MEIFLIELGQLFNKAFIYALDDAYFIFPIIGSIQFFLIGLFYKKIKFTYLSVFLILFFFAVFPFVKLIPNLGSDAFSEFQKINFSEAFFYIKTLNFFAGWSVKHFILWSIIVSTYITIILIIFILSKKFSFINFLKFNYIIIFAIIFIPTSINFYKVSILFNSSIIEKQNQAKNIRYNVNNLDIRSKYAKDLSVVFYIGEATSRLHWSLYKYFRPTNKNLENFSEINSLIIYDNIYSTHTHTSPSLFDTLTIKANKNDKNSLKIISEYSRYPIVDILNNVSIDTKLYSTQAKSGSWNLASSLIFKNANKKVYSTKYNLGNANYIDKDRPFDHEFLKKFTNEIAKSSNRNNFYVFHSYAGHGNYRENIPEKYHNNIDQFYAQHNNKAIFGKSFKNNQKEFLENYDSAMNYITDNIVFSLKKISKLKKPIIFIYSSDHGESPLTGQGHDSSRYIWEMSSVPFIIYFNKEAKNKYPDLFNELSSRAKKKNREVLSNLPSLILELFGIKIFHKNSKLDDVSICKFGNDECFEDYHIVRNQLNTLGVVNLKFPVRYDNNYIDNTDRASTHFNIKNYFSKKGSNLEVCSQRTNSIARFIRFNALLNCMEIDVIIKDNHLDVSNSNEETSSLNLVDLVKIQQNKENVLWLDLKNIQSPKDCDKLFISLKKIYSNNVKLNLFIEFPPNIINEISLYKKCILDLKSMNFLISYQMPHEIKSKCVKEMELDFTNENQCQFVEELIKKIYDSNLFTDLSFDYQKYNLIKDSKYIDKFFLNTRNINDDQIFLINEEKFRLISPLNDNINYN